MSWIHVLGEAGGIYPVIRHADLVSRCFVPADIDVLPPIIPKSSTQHGSHDAHRGAIDLRAVTINVLSLDIGRKRSQRSTHKGLLVSGRPTAILRQMRQQAVAIVGMQECRSPCEAAYDLESYHVVLSAATPAGQWTRHRVVDCPILRRPACLFVAGVPPLLFMRRLASVGPMRLWLASWCNACASAHRAPGMPTTCSPSGGTIWRHCSGGIAKPHATIVLPCGCNARRWFYAPRWRSR